MLKGRRLDLVKINSLLCHWTTSHDPFPDRQPLSICFPAGSFRRVENRSNIILERGKRISCHCGWHLSWFNTSIFIHSKTYSAEGICAQPKIVERATGNDSSMLHLLLDNSVTVQQWRSPLGPMFRRVLRSCRVWPFGTHHARGRLFQTTEILLPIDFVAPNHKK